MESQRGNKISLIVKKMILFYSLNQNAVILPCNIVLWSKYQILKLNTNRLWDMFWTACSQIAWNVMCLSTEWWTRVVPPEAWEMVTGPRARKKVSVGDRNMSKREEL